MKLKKSRKARNLHRAQEFDEQGKVKRFHSRQKYATGKSKWAKSLATQAAKTRKRVKTGNTRKYNYAGLTGAKLKKKSTTFVTDMLPELTDMHGK